MDVYIPTALLDFVKSKLSSLQQAFTASVFNFCQQIFLWESLRLSWVHPFENYLFSVRILRESSVLEVRIFSEAMSVHHLIINYFLRDAGSLLFSGSSGVLHFHTHRDLTITYDLTDVWWENLDAPVQGDKPILPSNYALRSKLCFKYCSP